MGTIYIHGFWYIYTTQPMKFFIVTNVKKNHGCIFVVIIIASFVGDSCCSQFRPLCQQWPAAVDGSLPKCLLQSSCRGSCGNAQGKPSSLQPSQPVLYNDSLIAVIILYNKINVTQKVYYCTVKPLYYIILWTPLGHSV